MLHFLMPRCEKSPPLLIVSVQRAIFDRRSHDRRFGDHYAVTGLAAPLAIPTTLHASLLARLDRLAPTREVAQIGAALGRSFSHELISAVAQIPRQKLDDALEQLVHAELIFRRGTPPHAEYTFKHVLVQDAAYSTLLRSRRHQLHGHITAILEAHFPEIVQTQPEALARHSAEAALPDKAVGYCLKAGQQAMARWAMTEAVAQLRRGLEFLSGIPDETLRNERELDLQIMLGQALVATKGYGADEPAQTYARARELCQQLNRPAQLGQVLWGHWVFCHVRAELEQAEEYSGAMRQLGDAQNDPMWKCFASAYSADTCSYLGKFMEARAYSEKALSLWNASYRAFAPTAGDPHVVSLISLSRALLCLGYVDQTRLRRNEMLAEARRLSPYTVAFALVSTWVVDWAIEGVQSATKMLTSADEVLAISGEQGYPLWMGFGNVMRGWSLSALGQTAEGLPLLLEGIGTIRATGGRLSLPFHLTTLGEAYGMQAQPKAGLDRLAEAAELVETTQERWAEAETHRLRGTLLQSVGEHAAAGDSYRHALDVARRQSAKLWELRAATSMARLWRDQGKRDEARDLPPSRATWPISSGTERAWTPYCSTAVRYTPPSCASGCSTRLRPGRTAPAHRLRGMFGFHPNLLISHRIPPPKAKLKKDRATVRLEDDLPFPNFDHGPPQGVHPLFRSGSHAAQEGRLNKRIHQEHGLGFRLHGDHPSSVPSRPRAPIAPRLCGSPLPCPPMCSKSSIWGKLGDACGARDSECALVFSADLIDPIFFEFIQRKDDEGFGEGNFRALFVSIEEDQIRRGVLKASHEQFAA